MLTFQDAKELNASELRQAIREERWTGSTVGLALGYVQANLAILPKDLAFEFLLFCQRNHAPCPVLEVTEAGSPYVNQMAKAADLRTDLPRYRVFREGELIDEPTNVEKYWRSDLVGFLIGCSLSFESALLDAGVPIRHVENNTDAYVYISNIECVPAGRFHGRMVVSMRPMPAEKAIRAVQVTTRFRDTHGAPIHIGDPEKIGIRDLNKVDFGVPPDIRPGELPVFWGCGITPQIVAMESKPEFMITHYPTHMFVCDLKDAEITVL